MNINSKRKQKAIQAQCRKVKMEKIARMASELAERCFQQKHRLPTAKSAQQKQIAVIAQKLLDQKMEEFNREQEKKKREAGVDDGQSAVSQ